MKKQCTIWLVVGLLSLVMIAGCESAQKSESASVEGAPGLESPADARVSAESSFQDWKEIWSVEIRGKEVSARKVGYLVKSFTQEDPDGRYFVRDLVWDTRGFLLPEGKAFAFEPRAGGTTPRDLGNTGRENGVKKILKVPGEVQFRAPTRPVYAPPQS